MKSIAKKNVVLIGFMGTGKTEVGKLLATALNRHLVDTDAQIEAEEGRTINEIFASDGEVYFRRKEAEVIAALCKQTGLVLSTGGGCVINPENVRNLRDNGCVIWLDATMEELKRRLAGDSKRPLLAQNKDFTALYRQREELYRKAAHVRVDTTGKAPLVVSEEIIAFLKKEV
ncbi:MAG: shikimate kinase [Firmicutes bacterium]|nr:shikimate kinase [Bacillota bacterium]